MLSVVVGAGVVDVARSSTQRADGDWDGDCCHCSIYNIEAAIQLLHYMKSYGFRPSID